MNNYTFFNDNSDFTFYKPSITRIGIQSLIIFDDNGLPIFSRFYGSQNETNDENEIFLVTAFISSLSHYILNYTKELFTDFSIGISRYYLKFVKGKIYCIIISEIISRRITGESLKSLLELTLNQLIKSVNNYSEEHKTKLFMEMNYLENFVLHIDTILFFNFKKAAEELESSNSEKKTDFDNFKVVYQHSNEYGPINHQLLIKGIQGLIIFDGTNKPIVIRDYAFEKNYNENIDYYTNIATAVKNFAENNIGNITDFGLGKTRVLVKSKKSEFMICMFISEILFWRINGEIINMFMELTLNDIVRSLAIYLDLFNYNKKGGLDKDSKSILNEQIDLLLLENSKTALKELNY